MQVEVDQSGKIGKTNEDTVLALSNGECYAIMIPRTVKQECLRILRERRISGEELYLRFFAVGLYYLLRAHIQRINLAIIDIEYPGHEAMIKQRLYNLLHRVGIAVQRNQISFGFVGKKSRAHVVALETFQRKRIPDQVLTVNDILKEF